jgi:hypothetical protein
MEQDLGDVKNVPGPVELPHSPAATIGGTDGSRDDSYSLDLEVRDLQAGYGRPWTL